MARYALKIAIYQLLLFGSLPNLQGASGYNDGHSFWTNQDLDPLSTSKRPSEPQFCGRYTHIWQKMASNGHTKVIYKGTFVSKQSLCTWYLKDFLCFLSLSLIFVRLSVRYHVLLEHLVSQHLTGLLKLISVSSGGWQFPMRNSLAYIWEIIRLWSH